MVITIPQRSPGLTRTAGHWAQRESMEGLRLERTAEWMKLLIQGGSMIDDYIFYNFVQTSTIYKDGQKRSFSLCCLTFNKPYLLR